MKLGLACVCLVVLGEKIGRMQGPLTLSLLTMEDMCLVMVVDRLDRRDPRRERVVRSERRAEWESMVEKGVG